MALKASLSLTQTLKKYKATKLSGPEPVRWLSKLDLVLWMALLFSGPLRRMHAYRLKLWV